MLSLRMIVLLLLMTVPLLVYLGLGAYALWLTGWFPVTWWILPGCWGVTWLVAALWPKGPTLDEVDLSQPQYWTLRDKQAAEVVRRFQKQVDDYTPAELTDPKFYVAQVQALAEELARNYHPGSTDPISSLTVPEVLASVRLAVDDLEEWMLESVPASHLITIQQWRWLGQAPKWVRRMQNTALAASVLLNPANIVRYFSSKFMLDPVTKGLQTEFLAAVYLRFIRQAGYYLIEMNSGRLRGGANKYRQTFGAMHGETAGERESEVSTAGDAQLESLTIAVVGQVKAGKSSLINACLGERVAEADVLPTTQHVDRYRFTLPGTDIQITFLDTPGYADDGITSSQIKEVTRATRESDILLLVLDAHAPARSADREMVDGLLKWYGDHQELKRPPVVICLTHIDLLSPMMEWNPPYDWRTPQNPKARNILEAVEYAAATFSDCSDTVIPVCTDVQRQRSSNIGEELLPALMSLVSEGQMAALLRAYHRNLNRERLQRLMGQLYGGSKALLKLWLDERILPGDGRRSSG